MIMYYVLHYLLCYDVLYCLCYVYVPRVSRLMLVRRSEETSLRRMSGNTQPLTATQWLRHTFPEIRASVIWLLTAGPIGHHLLSPAVNDKIKTLDI